MIYYLCIDEGFMMFRHMCSDLESARALGDKAMKKYNLQDVERFFILDDEGHKVYDYKEGTA